MANALIDENTMTAIADAIREKTGDERMYFPRDMPFAIGSIGDGLVEAESKSLMSRSIRIRKKLDETDERENPPCVTLVVTYASSDHMDKERKYINFCSHRIYIYPFAVSGNGQGIIECGTCFLNKPVTVTEEQLENTLSTAGTEDTLLIDGCYVYRSLHPDGDADVWIRQTFNETPYGAERFYNPYVRIRNGEKTRSVLFGNIRMVAGSPVVFEKYADDRE